MSNFHYKKGNIETLVRWDKPCPHVFMSLLKNHFTLFNDLSIEYDFYIWSNFLYSKTSWDIDIFVFGPPTAEIGDAIVEFSNIAHDPPYKQLLDFTLMEDTKIFKGIEPFNRTKNCVHDLIGSGTYLYKAHGITMKNGRELGSSQGEQIHENLWKKPHIPFQQKFIDRKHVSYPMRLDHFIRMYERINL